MPRTRKRTSRGFTLIELMVVIAIIAILAGILFPVFAGARDKADQIACISNMRQIGMAFHMYANDWNELLPPQVVDAATGELGYRNWSYGWNNMPSTPTVKASIAYLVYALEPYMQDAIWFCPNDVWRKVGTQPFGTPARAQAGEISYSYAVQWNTWLDNPALFHDPNCPAWMNQPVDLVRPNLSQQLLMVGNGLPDAPGPDLTNYQFAHARGCNALYLDGHSKFLAGSHYGLSHPPLVWYDAP